MKKYIQSTEKTASSDSLRIMVHHAKVLSCLLIILAVHLQNTLLGAELRVVAAASLSPLFEKISSQYANEKGCGLIMTYGASGTLAKQIQQGAPVDVFISADTRQMDYLEEKNLILKDTRKIFLTNKMVIVSQKENYISISEPRTLLVQTIDKIAIGVPDIVPAGDYAKRFLIQEGLWESLQTKLVPMENVRSVLATVKSGNAKVGFVYYSDAVTEVQVKVIYAIPKSAGIIAYYPLAITQSCQKVQIAKEFIDYLENDSVTLLIKEFGFGKP